VTSRRVRAALVGLLVAGLSAGCGLGSSGESDTGPGSPIKIGTLLSVTGPAANLGDKMRKGAEMAVEEINADGGINGRKIDWVFYDPAGDTSTAVQQTRRMLDSDGVDVLVGGGAMSGIALAMNPSAAESGTVFVATEGARQIVQPATEHPLSFKTTFNDTAMVQRVIDFWKSKGITRAAFLPDTSSFGQSALEEMERLAPAAGIKVDVAAFDPAATDLMPQIKRLAANKPQAYLAWTTSPSGVTFLKNVRSVVTDDTVMVMHGFGFVDDRYMQQAGEAGKGTILVSPKLPVVDKLPADDVQKPVIEEFTAAYAKRYQGEQPNVYAGQAYDAMMVAAEALKANDGSTEGASLAKAIEGLGEHVGVTGVFRYTNEDHSGLAPSDAAMIQWDGSRFVPAS